jgi:Rieske Fe-S protein
MQMSKYREYRRYVRACTHTGCAGIDYMAAEINKNDY